VQSALLALVLVAVVVLVLLLSSRPLAQSLDGYITSM
jgi:hypothetical protein